jgi:hypothetical protein
VSRLDSFIRRLMAQRACLDRAVALADTVPGVVVELGLGNGRTYDHLREHLPRRRILVLERAPNPHAASRPADADLLVGDLAATLPALVRDFEGQVALLHSDIGCGDPVIDREVAALVARHAGQLLPAGGIAVSDQPLRTGGALEAIALPSGVEPGRYFMYRAMPAGRSAR